MFKIVITMADNEDLVHAFRWLDESGQPVSLSADTLLMDIKRKVTDLAPVLELSSATSGLAIDEGDSSRFEMRIPRGALKIGNYVFDLVRQDASAARYRMATGTIKVEQGVTR